MTLILNLGRRSYESLRDTTPMVKVSRHSGQKDREWTEGPRDLHKQSTVRFNRIVLKPIVLKDGTVIPKGYTIEAPYAAFVNDARIYPEPDTFNPYRFVNLREGKAADPIGYKSTEQYQFVTVTKENMGFGYGRHSW